MRPNRSWLLLLLCALTAGAAAGASRPPSLTSGVSRTVLPNGLTLLVRESRRAPVVAVFAHVKAGYFDEPDRVAGMAHLFEHMLFRGSSKYPDPAAVNAVVRGIGAQRNAGTGYDSTTYFLVTPKEGLTTAMELMGDAIAAPLFNAQALQREAEVVIEESNRKYDNAPAFAMEKLFALSFAQHRMRRWRIGSHDVLRNIRRDDLLQFYQSLYRPENLILTIVGDVDAPSVLATAQRTFGALPRGTPRREPGPTEPAQTAFRMESLTGDIQNGLLTVGFHTPGVNHRDNAALDVLADILARGRSARLYRGAVRTGLAQSVMATNVVAGDVGSFTLQARVDPVRLSELEERVFEEIERLKRGGVSRAELERARNGIETTLALDLEDALGQARSLADYEAHGSFKELDRYVARMRALRADQIQSVARRYLTFSNASVLRYLPRNAVIPAVTAMTRAQQLAERMERVPVPPAGRAPASASPEEAPDPAADLPRTGPRLDGGEGDRAPQRFTLPNGVRLLVQERHTVPTAALTVAFAGGKARETPAQAGITELMLASLTKGTRTRDAEALDRAIEALGTSLDPVVREDTFALSMSLLSRNVAPALEIVRAVLREPTFPEAEVRRARELQLAAVRQSRDDALSYPVALLNRALYGDHPYGWPTAGREESVATLDARPVRDWYRRSVDPATMWIIVVGDVRAEPLRAAVTAAFGDWRMGGTEEGSPPTEAGAPVPLPSLAPGPPKEAVEQRARRQTAFALGFVTVPARHSDRPALDVIQSLTSGLAGRFGTELRGRQALAYVTGASHRALAQGGVFFGYLAGAPEKEAPARAAMRAEFDRLAREPVGAHELQQAQTAIAGALKIALQRNAATATELMANALLAGDPEYTARYLEQIGRVTPADVQRAASTYFGDRCAIGILRGGG